MQTFKIVTLCLLGFNILGNILLVGKERKPITSGQAVFATLIDGVLGYLVIFQL